MTVSLKKIRIANQLTNQINRKIEEELKTNLQTFFETLKQKVLIAFDEYYNETFLLQGHINLILAPIHEAEQEYYELLLKYNTMMYERGKKQGLRFASNRLNALKAKKKTVDILPDKDNLFGTIDSSENHLREYTFTASDKTMSRVDEEINSIIADGYRSGAGVKDVHNRILERYDQFSSWEANRIARTEMQTAHNMGVMQSYQELGVEYKEWRSAEDKRVRRSHMYLDGEIVPLDQPFSNGLMFPGDKSGKIGEWINCRCSVLPYLMPPGSSAPPGQSSFRETDLVNVTEPNYGRLLQKETGGALNWQQYKQILHGKPLEQVLVGVTVAETKQQQKEKPTPKQVTTEPKTETKSMLEGKPTITQDSKGTLYTYENGLELHVSKNSYLSHEEVLSHINSLPKPLRSINTLKRIEISPEIAMRGKSGEYDAMTKTLKLFRYDGTKEKALDTLTHELAHAYDNQMYKGISKGGAWGVSDVEVYEKIVKADNELKAYIRPNGKKRVPNIFPTEYAGRSWKKAKRNYKERMKVFEKGSLGPEYAPQNTMYIEDFADSTKLYLNPSTHKQFVEDFPNRAKYLEELYGKPNFDKNSPLYKELIKKGLI